MAPCAVHAGMQQGPVCTTTWPAHPPASLNTSVGCGVDLPDSGAVVKPTWLLITTWMVPPVVKPGTLLSCRHSGTMP